MRPKRTINLPSHTGHYKSQLHTGAIRISVLLAVLLLTLSSWAQSSGLIGSSVTLTKNASATSYKLFGTYTSLSDLHGQNLGSILRGSGTLTLTAGDVRTYECLPDDVTATTLYYRVFPAAGTPGAWTAITPPSVSNIGTATTCSGPQQSWSFSASSTNLLSGISALGNYVVQFYAAAAYTTGAVSGTYTANNGGSFYEAGFTLASNDCVTGIAVTPNSTQTYCQGAAANALEAAISKTSGSGAASITYQWFSNTSNSTVGGTSVAGPAATTTATDKSYFTPPTTTAGTRWYYCVVTNTDGSCTGTSFTTTPVAVIVNANSVPSVNVEAYPGYTFCQGTSVMLAVQSSANLGASPSYQWQLSTNGGSTWTNVGSAATYSSTTFNQNDKVRLLVTPGSDVSCPSPATATSNVVTMTVNPIVVPSAVINVASTNICSGTSVTFTAEPTNGGATPIYQWRLNGNIVGTNSINYTNASLANGDIIALQVTSNATCATPATVSAPTRTMTVTTTLPVSVALSASSTSICPGTSVTFTAAPTNGGASPTYQWRINGTNIGGPVSSNTFTRSNLNNGDVVSVVMTNTTTTCTSSNPATSNNVTMTVNPNLPVSVSIGASATTICAGTSVTFTATPTNGGAAPSYQWLVNGSNAGTNSATFTTTTLAHNAVVTVVLTSNATPCATGNPATSNAITMTVNAQPTLVLETSASTTNQTICIGSAINNIRYDVEGTVSTVNVTGLPAGVTGVLASGKFTISGTPTASGTFAYTVTTAGSCTNVSATGTIVVNANGAVTLSSAAATASQSVCINSTITNITYAIGGSATYLSTTGLPSGVVASLSGSTVTISGMPTVSGTFPYTVSTSGPCTTPTISGTITVNPQVTPSVSLVASTTSTCSSSPVTLTATPTNGGASPTYQWFINGSFPQAWTGNTVTVSSLMNANTVTVRMTSNAACASPTQVTSNGITMSVASAAPTNWKNNENISASASTICPPATGVTFSIVAATNAATYDWTLPTGFTITSGAGTRTITVSVSTSAASINNQVIQVRARNGCGTNTAKTVNVSVSDFATVNVGNDTSVCVGGSVQLTATRVDVANNKVTWTATAGTFSKQDTLVTVYTPPATPGAYRIIATPGSTTAACKITPDTLWVTVKATPTASISGTTTICSGSNANLTVTATPNTTVTYKVGSGANQTISVGASGTATLNTGALAATTTVSLVSIAYPSMAFCSAAASGSVTVTVNPAAVVSAGSNAAICSGTPYTLNGTVTGGTTSGTWSAPSGTFANASVPNTTYTASTTGPVVLTLTSADPDGAGPCTAVAATVTLTVSPIATVSAGASQTICASNTATMAGAFGGSATSATWSTSGTGTFNNNAPTAIYTPSAADIAAGSVVLTYTAGDPDGSGPCAGIASSMTLTINPIAMVVAGTAINSCQAATPTAITLSGASITGGTTQAAWSIVSGGGTLSSTAMTSNPGAVQYTPAAGYSGAVVLRLTSDDPIGPCGVVFAERTINVFQQATVSAGANQSVCSNTTVFLSGAFGGGATSAIWSTSGTGTFSDNTPTAIYTPSTADVIAGSVTLTYTTNDPAGPCNAASASMTLSLSQVPIVSAGPNQTICSNSTATMNASLSGGGTSGTWTTTGTGTFSSNTALNAVYTPSAADVIAGSVVLTFTSNDPVGPCNAVASSMTLTVHRVPQITTQPVNRAVCATFGVNLSVVAVGTGLTYQWYKGTAPSGTPITNGGTISGATNNILSISQADNPDAGKYYVVISGTSSCPSITSNTVNLQVDQKININTQPVSKELCFGANTTFSVAASTANGDALTYQWRKDGIELSGETGMTLTITNATSADEGIYDVIVRGPSGFTCSEALSAPATLTINPLPSMTATASGNPICSQSNLTITLGSSAANTTYNWTLTTTGGANIAPIGNSGSTTASSLVHTPNTPGPGNGVLQYQFTPEAKGCLGAKVNLNVSVRPLPVGSITAGVSGSVAVCQNAASPAITFSGGNGTLPYTFTYRINGGASQTVTTSASSTSVTVAAPTTTAGTFVYTLVGVGDQNTTGCSQGASGAATVTVNPTPSATITGGTTVCIGTSSPLLTITGSGGTAPYTFRYSINGGANITVVSNSGGVATINASTATAGSFVYQLTGVTDNSSTTCSATPTGNTTVNITPNSTITLTSAVGTNNQTICINNAVTNITYLVGGSGTNASITGLPAGVTGAYNSTSKVFTISGVSTVSGSFPYTITTAGPCANVQATGTIVVDRNPIGGTTSNSNGNFACASSNGGTVSLSGHEGNVLRWERSTDGGQTWTNIANTATSNVYSNLTETTWFRAVIGKALCTGVIAYSTHTAVSVIGTTASTGGLTATSSPQFICSGSATLSATGFGSGASIGEIGGGEFDNAGSALDQQPGRWRCYDNGVLYNMQANADNEASTPFNLTNDKNPGNNNNRVFAGTAYSNNPLDGQANSTKFCIVAGARTSTLETPIFNLLGLTTASINWYSAFKLDPGTTMSVEISLDGGNTYNTTLRVFTGNQLPGTDFKKFAVDLSAYVGLQNLRVRFKYVSTSATSSWGMEMATISKGTAPVNYTWNLINPAPPTNVVSDHYLNAFVSPSVIVTPPSPNTGTAPVTYIYSIQASTGGCVSNIPVTVNPTPNAVAVSPGLICSGTTINIPITGRVAGTTFTWVRNANPNISGTNGSCSSGTCATINETLTNLTNTAQTVTYTVTPFYSNGGVSCPGVPVNIDVLMLPRPTATINASFVCNGGNGTYTATVSLNITGSGAISGTLMPGNVPFSGTAPGTITVSMPVTASTTYTIGSLNVGGCTPVSLPAGASITIPTAGAAGLWVGRQDNDWFNACNWANNTVPNNNVAVTIPASATRFCEINPNTSPFATTYGDVARSANILITSQELRFGPSLPKLSLLNTRGNLTIENATGYVNMISGGEIEITGSWYNNRSTAGFAEGAGAVELIGTTVQHLSTVDNIETYNNLIVNNSSDLDNAVTLDDSVNVSGVLTLVSGARGRVLTSQTKLMTVTNPAVASVVGGEESIYINGPLARHSNTTGVYNFPVGKPNGPYGVYRPDRMIPQSTSATVYNCEYFGASGPTLGQRIMLGILNTEYWEINRTSGNANAIVQLFYINPNNDAHWSNLGPSTCGNNCPVAITKRFSEASDTWYFTNYPSFSSLSLAVPEATVWNNGGRWLSSKVMTSFSPFTFAYDYSTVLRNPVTLLHFDGKLEQDNGHLSWRVNANDEVKRFDLEHSTDGLNFTSIGSMNKGGSLNYDFVHTKVAFGANFYRLVVHDTQGKTSYSRVVELTRSGNLITRIHGLRSNPIQYDAMLKVTSAASQHLTWTLVDQQGKVLLSGKALAAKGENTIRLPMPMIPNGFFFLHARTEDGVSATLKLVKE